jgi:hypothetical protein
MPEEGSRGCFRKVLLYLKNLGDRQRPKKKVMSVVRKGEFRDRIVDWI